MGWGKPTRRIVKLLQKQEYETWNNIFTQIAHAGEDLKKCAKKVRGVSQSSPGCGDDSDSEIEVYPSNT